MKYLSTKAHRPVSVINEMDRMFNHFFDNANAPVNRGFATDIVGTAEGYRIEADLPGFTPADVDVRVEGNLLVIEAKGLESTPRKEKDEENHTWYFRERIQGNRKRAFVLPEDVDKSGIQAGLINGSLAVTLKKKPEFKPFTVKVQG